MKTVACILAATLASAAGGPAFADEPPKDEDKKEPEKKPEPRPEDDPLFKGPKETGAASPQSNPWADAGLAKRREGQQPTSASASTTAPRRPSGTDLSAKPISAALLAGYASENYRVGLGVQAGYTIYGVYLGGTFVYQLGQSVGDVSANVYYPGFEIGYDFPVEEVLVRPYVGVDYVTFHLSTGSESASKAYLGIHPGLHVDYQVPDTPIFAGIDGRVLLIPDVLKDATPSVGVFLVVGARF